MLCAGYEGTDCERNTNECSGDPCKNGARCEDKLARFECHCVDGYTGNLCQYDVDECASTPCQNGATCTDRINGYHCSCYTGTCRSFAGRCSCVYAHAYDVFYQLLVPMYIKYRLLR